MRDRHWTSIQTICESTEPVDVTNPTFCLNSLIELGVQDHSDDVEEVIEMANKELKVGRKLKDIGLVWKKLSLVYKNHKGTLCVCVLVMVFAFELDHKEVFITVSNLTYIKLFSWIHSFFCKNQILKLN